MRVEAECSPDYTEWVIRVSDAPAGTNLREVCDELDRICRMRSRCRLDASAADVKQVTKLAYDLAKGYKFRSDKGGSSSTTVDVVGMRFVIQRDR